MQKVKLFVTMTLFAEAVAAVIILSAANLPRDAPAYIAPITGIQCALTFVFMALIWHYEPTCLNIATNIVICPIIVVFIYEYYYAIAHYSAYYKENYMGVWALIWMNLTVAQLYTAAFILRLLMHFCELRDTAAHYHEMNTAAHPQN